MADHAHDHHHHDVETFGVALLTVSSSRTLENDPAGDRAEEAIRSAGHHVVGRELTPDDQEPIEAAVRSFLADPKVDVVVTMGGTGITPDDVTPEAVRPLFDRALPGFGERYRAASADDIGPRAIGSRATAGVAEGVPVFVVPGSEAAVMLAVTEFILPVGGHLVGLAGR